MNPGREARQSLPLHPATISRESAASSRKQEIPTPVRQSSERLLMGEDGLRAKVRAELSETYFHLPKERLSHSPEEGAIVAIASGNSIKTDRMLEILNTKAGGGFKVIRVPEAEETHSLNVITDATSKARDAAERIQHFDDTDARRFVRHQPYVTWATDQLNAAPGFTIDPRSGLMTLCFERLGKPATDHGEQAVESIKHTFQKMAFMADILNWSSVPYLAEIATVIHNPKYPDDDAVSVQKSVIFLSKDGLRQLASDRFDEYVAKVSKKFDITKIAGGLEVQVLEEMGLVEFVTGTAEEVQMGTFPKQRDEAVEHTHRIALGNADERHLETYFTSEEN